MKLLVDVAEEQIANDGAANEQCYFQALVVFNLDAVEIRLEDSQFPQSREYGHSDIRVLALLCLFPCWICRLAGHVARHILAQPALLAPGEIDSRGVYIGAGIGLGAVKVGIARRPECDLRQAELPAYGAAPFCRRVLNNDLRVRVVQLNRKLGGVDGLGRGRHSAVLANLLLGQCWVRPARLCEDFAIEDLWVARIEQGYRICVFRCVGGRVDVVKGILRIWLRPVLGEVE